MTFWFPEAVMVPLSHGAVAVIARAGVELCESLHAIEVRAHSHPMAMPTFVSSLQRYHCLSMQVDGRYVGFAMVSVVVAEAELIDFVVSPDMQGRGVGSRVLERILSELEGKAERMFLEVRVSNKPAIALYHSQGFVEVGLRRNYYPAKQGREDALLMAIEILPPAHDSL